MSHEEYSRLAGKKRTLLELLRMPGIAEVELDIPKREIDPRPADLD
jgi:hypothetical protein